MNAVVVTLCALLAIAQGRTIQRDEDGMTRVVNGEDVKLGERPFQVSLQSRGSHMCGGSIVNENWVVTAGHCVDGDSPSSLSILVGTVDLRELYSVHRVEQIVVHKNYSPRDSYRDDIALLKVDRPFEFSSRVQPVALPEPHVNVKTNSSAVLSGWGYRLDWTAPEILQKATIYIADPDYCRDVMQERNLNIHPTNVCANDPSMRRGQCNGDSGGPLTVDGKLAGIVSWSIKDPDCASTKYPGVYTRVSEYVEWIHDNIKANSP